jgi:menaquinone-dependent protoporphyrinogen IX oxidase
MAKTLVIYFSKYGTTKRYAEWIAEELNADICTVKEIKPQRLPDYDTIIFGSALRAGTIKGINILIKNHEILKDKKLVFYTCGLTDYTLSENIASIVKRLKQVIPSDICKHIQFYHLRGGINYQRLNLIDKVLMRILKKQVEKKEPSTLTQENKEFIATYGQKVDFTDKTTIKGLVEYCKCI